MATVEPKKEESVLTAWEVKGTVDYDKMIRDFGAERVDEKLLDKFRRVTGKEPHPMLKRGIFYAHRGLNDFLDAYARGEPVFLYTGRGPTSESMHMGHMVPFAFTRWLQDIFQCPLVIQIADDEKYFFRNLKWDDVYRMGFENAKDIIAYGFDEKKTFIFSNRDYRLGVKAFEEFVTEMKMKISARTVAKIFGFDQQVEEDPTEDETKEDSKNKKEEKAIRQAPRPKGATVAMYDWTFYQSAAAFSQAFPHIFNGNVAHCLVAYAIDQDPYFRMTGDIARAMRLFRPCSIMSKFIAPLTGVRSKMSSSNPMSTIFLTDNEKLIREKIMKHAFSGSRGDGTLESHKKLGGDPEEDISFQYLRYFYEDDVKLEEIRTQFSSGAMTCSTIKGIMADMLVCLITEHQRRRANVTQKDVDEFYRMKPMDLKHPTPENLVTLLPTISTNVVVKTTEDEDRLYKVLDDLKISHTTLYHNVIKTMTEGKEIATKVNGTVCKNLLLMNIVNGQYYLYICNGNTKTNISKVGKEIGVKKLQMAPRDALQKVLHVPEGCATLFSLINDTNHKVGVLIDANIPETEPVNFHPMRNDATTTISYADMFKFLLHYTIAKVHG
jgi:tryptophanyl-tRNA synthetase